MFSVLVFSIIGLSFDLVGCECQTCECAPCECVSAITQYDLITPSEPLANVTDSIDCQTCTISSRIRKSDPQPQVTSEPQEACTSGSCGSYQSYESVRYQPVKRGVFGRMKRGRCASCR